MKTPSPEAKECLKQLAKLGALHDFVYTSSSELAERLGVSQQTASRKILELVDGGWIHRKVTTRKQLIRVSPAGVDVLKHEAAEYKGLFASSERVKLRGRVVAGLGEGRYYISREGYTKAFLSLLGFEPFPGTLNVEIEPLDRDKMGELKEREGLLIKEFQSEGRTFGAVKCFRAEVDGVEAAAIFPLRSHHANVLELVSPAHLRSKLNLKDGDELLVTVKVDG